jgi:hypothetical protein
MTIESLSRAAVSVYKLRSTDKLPNIIECTFTIQYSLNISTKIWAGAGLLVIQILLVNLASQHNLRTSLV